jgi:hypothetical protein
MNASMPRRRLVIERIHEFACRHARVRQLHILDRELAIHDGFSNAMPVIALLLYRFKEGTARCHRGEHGTLPNLTLHSGYYRP